MRGRNLRVEDLFRLFVSPYIKGKEEKMGLILREGCVMEKLCLMKVYMCIYIYIYIYCVMEKVFNGGVYIYIYIYCVMEKVCLMEVYIYIYIHTYIYIYIQGVPGGKDLTSGECSLGQTITI
jgi:hypothetical protein